MKRRDERRKDEDRREDRGERGKDREDRVEDNRGGDPRRPRRVPRMALPEAILSWTEHWIAVDKPSGLPSRPAPGYAGSALSQIEQWLAAQAPELPRPGVVHRLDRETSGVLVFSLGPQGHRALEYAFRGAIRKEYRAAVMGWPRPRHGLIELPLLLDSSRRVRPDRNGRPSRTRYSTLRRFRDAALVKVEPLTGRTHQIRVHLAARGTAVLGDRIYGAVPAVPGDRTYGAISAAAAGAIEAAPLLRPPRLCLHALRLSIPAQVLGPLGAISERQGCDRRVYPHETPAVTRSLAAGHSGGPSRARSSASADTSIPPGSWTIEAPMPADLVLYLGKLESFSKHP